MKRFVLSLFALVALAGGMALAQTQYLPIPSGVCTASGQVLASDSTGNNVQCTAAPSLTSITLGSTSTITRISDLSFTVSPSSVSATSCAEQSVSIGGLTTSDRLIINPSQLTPASYGGPVSFVAARVSTAGVAAFVYCNSGSIAATPTSGSYTGFAIRKS